MGTHLESDGEALRISGRADHEEMARPRQLCHACAQQSDGSGSDHGDTVTGAHAGIHADSVVSHAAGLSQRGCFQRKDGRHMMKTAGRNLHEGSHGAVDSISEPESSRLQVVKTLANQRRIGGQHRGGLADDAISLGESRNAAAPSFHYAGKFVAKYHGIIDLPAVFAMVLMQIASANANRFYSHEDIVVADLRNWNLPELGRTRVFRVVHQSKHCLHPQTHVFLDRDYTDATLTATNLFAYRELSTGRWIAG